MFGSIALQRARFYCFLFPVGGRPVYVLQISLPRVGCRQKIWVASLSQMCFELSNVSLKSFFFKPFFAPGG